jgi:hypothetical protein
MDGAVVTFNTEEFRQTFRRYLALNKRDVPRLINNKAYRVLLHYVRLVRRASREQIEALGVVGYRFQRTRKTGKTYRSKRGNAAIIGKRPRAQGIVVAKMRAAGKLEASSWAEIQDLTRKLIMDRIKAIGYLASAGMPALRAFGNAVNKSQRPMGSRDVKEYTAPKGRGIPATPEHPVATIVMEPVIGQSARAQQHVIAALNQGFMIETASMEQYIVDKLVKNARAAGIEAYA